MNHSIRHLVQLASATILLMFSGATAAFAGPAPLVEPQFPPPAADPVPVTANGFPWLITSVAVLLTIAAVAMVAVLWNRIHAGHHGLVTP